MTQHRITLPFLSGGSDPAWNIFTMSNNNQQEEEEGNFPLRKMKFRVVLTKAMFETKGKTISEVPVRTVGDIMF